MTLSVRLLPSITTGYISLRSPRSAHLGRTGGDGHDHLHSDCLQDVPESESAEGKCMGQQEVRSWFVYPRALI